jgi:hypothetical protein
VSVGVDGENGLSWSTTDGEGWEYCWGVLAPGSGERSRGGMEEDTDGGDGGGGGGNVEGGGRDDDSSNGGVLRGTWTRETFRFQPIVSRNQKP